MCCRVDRRDRLGHGGHRPRCCQSGLRDNGSHAGDINNDGIPGGITDVGKDVGEFAVRQDVETARHRATHVATAEPVMARAVRSHLGGEW